MHLLRYANFSSCTLSDMVAHPRIYMKLIMWPYAPSKTMHALVFGDNTFLLFSPPNFHLLILLLLLWLTLHILFSLIVSRVTHGKLVILVLMANIITQKKFNVTKELRSSLISSVGLIFIPSMSPTINIMLAKIIAWETITIKWNIVTIWWRYSLHACLRMHLLFLLLLVRGFDLSITANFGYMSTYSTIITYSKSILLLWTPFILKLLAWLLNLIFLVATHCLNSL